MALLADPERRPIDARSWMVVVAHPDDETLGIGAQLHRLRGLRLVLVTDGAPRQGDDARARGFADPAAYAQARQSELEAALIAAGAPDLRPERLDIPDQEAGHRLEDLARRLAALFAGIEVVLTHAYEGGHPDHDATAFAVHAAVAAMPEGSRPTVVEMPFYRLDADGAFVTQTFEPVPGHPPVRLQLTDGEIERKRAMMAAHRSQADVLAPFESMAEEFRESPSYDFATLPNGGALRYEPFAWSGERGYWLALVDTVRQTAVTAG